MKKGKKAKESQTEKKRKSIYLLSMQFVLFFVCPLSPWLGRSVRSDIRYPMAIAVICDLYMISFRFHLHLWCLLSFPMPTESVFDVYSAKDLSYLYLMWNEVIDSFDEKYRYHSILLCCGKESASVTCLLDSFGFIISIGWLDFHFGFSHPCVSMIGVTHQDCAERKELEKKKEQLEKQKEKD